MKKRSLLGMLICLTLLLFVAQISFYAIHAHVSELMDVAVSASFSQQLWHAAIVMPLMATMMIALIGYALLIGWIWFSTQAIAELFKCGAAKTYWLGLLNWSLIFFTLFALNAYDYPHSFFADRFVIARPILISLVALTIIFALLSYVGVILLRHRYVIGGFYLLLMASLWAPAFFGANPRAIAQTTSSQLNIILIGIDSLRPDFVGYLGAPSSKTKTIDAFLKSSSVFTNAYTPLARTFPAWMSVLTGKYPIHHHARIDLADPTHLITQDTIAKRLRAVGYQTMFGIDDPRFANINEQYGFDIIFGPKKGVVEFILAGLNDFPLTNLLMNLPLGEYLFPYQYGNRGADIQYQPTSFLNLMRHALQQRSQKPLFLAVHLCLPHWPYTWAQDGVLANANNVERYQQSVASVDQQLNGLLMLLQQAGLLNHSIVVLFSDHGVGLGMLGDRLTDKKFYQDHNQQYKMLGVSRLYTAASDSVDILRDFTINTSYGQGNDVLSSQQYHCVLGMKGYGVNIPSQKIHAPVMLQDIPVTLLSMLSPRILFVSEADGVSLQPFLQQVPRYQLQRKARFIETGDKVAAIETDQININNVVKSAIGLYNINPQTGMLQIKSDAEKSVIAMKQRAIISGDWLLARYPQEVRLRIVTKHERAQLHSYVTPPYFVLINLRTHHWTMQLTSAFAKHAPIQEMLKEFNAFYGNEVRHWTPLSKFEFEKH